jgi:hypothetical protein
VLGAADDDDHRGVGPVLAAQGIRDRLAERLTGWDEGDIATFAQLVTRFNQSRGDRPTAKPRF